MEKKFTKIINFSRELYFIEQLFLNKDISIVINS